MLLKKKFLAAFFFIVFLFGISLLAETRAANEGTITASVTARNISISVGLTAVDFGTVGVGSSADTTLNGRNTSITATNNGNDIEKFSITTGDSTNWTAEVAPDTNKFRMNFCTSNCDVSPTWNIVGIDSAYQTLAASVASSGNQQFDLQIKTPSSTTFYTQQTISLTVLAEIPD